MMTVLNPPKSDSTMADSVDNTSSNVKVIVRVRPPNDLEKNEKGKQVVEVMNENILVFDPKEESSPCFGRRGRRQHRDIRKRRHKDLKFAFDFVFGWTSSNNEVFEQTTRTVLDGLLGGYNCSVFAYGATGAGKTHTMLGSESHPGVIYHTMIHLYKHISEMSEEKTCDVAVSYLEVYNEQIRDLLLPRGTLPIREDPSSGVIVPGLSLHKPNTAEELLYMLQFGNKNRTQHPTDANAESSRSHAVFQVFVRQKDKTANITAEVKVAKMCLVDLAGSERATVTKNRGARLREGANINRSLLALGNVINSLADQKYKGHVPYRDSKLTRLLKDSLGGNCRTIMIAAVSPSHLSYEDTYNTLKYADRAKNIRLNMKKNVLNVDFHISRYGKIVEELRREITELKSKLQQCDGPRISQPTFLPAELQSLCENLQSAYNDRRVLRDQQLKQETSVRDLQWRLHCKQKCLNRATQLTHSQPETFQKIQNVMQSLQKKLTGQEVHRQTLSQQLQDNTQKLTCLQSQATAANNKGFPGAQMLEVTMQKLSHEVSLNDCHHYIHHLRRLARAHEREAVTSETLISALLHLVQRQHVELQNRGCLAPDVATDYQRVCELVGQWGVSWADTEERGKGDGEQEPFHINSVIDIPLMTTAGVMMDRIPLPAKPVPTACSTNSATAPVGRLNPAMSCPGRVVNGQVMFSTVHSSTAVAQPAVQLTTAIYTTVPQSSVRHNSHLHAVPAERESASCDVSNHNSANDPSVFNSVGSVSEARASPVTTVYAGHTPNPKILGQYTDSGRSQVQLPAPSAVSSSQQTFGHTQAKVIGKSEASAWKSMAPETKSSAMPHSLNETFCVEDSCADMCTNVCGEMNSTMIIDKPTLLAVPVISAPPSAARQLLHGNVIKDRAQTPQSGISDTYVLQPSLHLDAAVPQQVLVTHKQQGLGLQNCNTSFALSASKVNAGQVSSAGESGTSLNSAGKENGSGQSLRKEDKENGEMFQMRNSSAKRAINFNGLTTTPVRVEGKSYADAVKTPTPPRQPLQNLDCNSPHLKDRILPAGPNQTPKSSTHVSMYLADPQTLDNMRRLKQLGMPSLVENLITGSKGALNIKTGPADNSRPSYMQPTKATARRVRQQPYSRDDSSHPRRVPNKTLAHSRSKSTSALTKTGWKL